MASDFVLWRVGKPYGLLGTAYSWVDQAEQGAGYRLA